MIDYGFWNRKRVLLTGHTGFKGSWLSLWLELLGAEVYGLSSGIPTIPSIFESARLEEKVVHNIGDVRNLETVIALFREVQPEIVFHLAAQPIVRLSYNEPIETLSTNIMGTSNVLEAVRVVNTAKAIVNVTTDKCYLNREWHWGYRENDELGGYDPYSVSKACSELVTSSYRDSYYKRVDYGQKHSVAVGTARAGNVIGGGDWAQDRLLPDIIRAFSSSKPAIIRNPYSIRPWQHVLEPLAGYLLLAEKLYLSGPDYAEAWNFGPMDSDAKPVEWIIKKATELWGDGAEYQYADGVDPLHESKYLKLDISKSRGKLGWQPKWDVNIALRNTVDWYKKYSRTDVVNLCREQIASYMDS